LFDHPFIAQWLAFFDKSIRTAFMKTAENKQKSKALAHRRDFATNTAAGARTFFMPNTPHDSGKRSSRHNRKTPGRNRNYLAAP
jgi:hypothetical protein